MNEMSLAAVSEATSAPAGEVKDLYEIGEMPPLGHVPKNMYAWAIRKDRHGPPDQAMQIEVLPTWQLDSHEVLVLVMAAGVNYNGVWASLGKPVSTLDGHKNPFHIAGSDASGIVYAVGSKVKRWKVGDEVVVHCNQDDGDDEECNGGDPMFSPSQRIWSDPGISPGKKAHPTCSCWLPPIACCLGIARTCCVRATTCWFGGRRVVSVRWPYSSSPPPVPTPSAS